MIHFVSFPLCNHHYIISCFDYANSVHIFHMFMIIIRETNENNIVKFTCVIFSSKFNSPYFHTLSYKLTLLFKPLNSSCILSVKEFFFYFVSLFISGNAVIAFQTPNFIHCCIKLHLKLLVLLILK